MAVRVMIPTPLRVYAGKRDSAEFRASTVGEALAQLTAAPIYGRRKSAQLRECVRKWRRYPVSFEGRNTHEGWRHHQHHSVDRRRTLLRLSANILRTGWGKQHGQQGSDSDRHETGADADE
jgi:hypothetical protein